MVNTLKIKALIIENNYTNELISKKLGISKQSFSMKLNNKREFKASEINKLQLILKININDFVKIFFANNVELNSTSPTKKD